MKRTVILVNLGTPEYPTRKAIRQFLRKFLSDPRVVELPRWLWLPILYFFILPFRPRKLLHAYQSIWQSTGSPIRISGNRLAARLREIFAARSEAVTVRYAETYGTPAIDEQLHKILEQDFAHTEAGEIVVLPLYPQYSGSTAGSVCEQIATWMQGQRVIPTLRIISDYHAHPAYINALAMQIQNYWQTRGRSERLLISFHGLPQRMVDNGDPYERQCRTTASLLADALKLDPTDYQVVFQSRFGRAPWLQPYADKTLQEWGSGGLKSVDIVCPGFAVDCLETLEEMAIANKMLFHNAGGGEYRMIPCLNDSTLHAQCLEQIIGRSDNR